VSQSPTFAPTLTLVSVALTGAPAQDRTCSTERACQKATISGDATCSAKYACYRAKISGNATFSLSYTCFDATITGDATCSAEFACSRATLARAVCSVEGSCSGATIGCCLKDAQGGISHCPDQSPILAPTLPSVNVAPTGTLVSRTPTLLLLALRLSKQLPTEAFEN
jgi:hypothetical protein